MTPEMMAVLADAMRDAGLSEEQAERALAAIDAPQVYVVSGAKIDPTELTGLVGNIVHFVGEPPTASPPLGYTALLSRIAELEERPGST